MRYSNRQEVLGGFPGPSPIAAKTVGVRAKIDKLTFPIPHDLATARKLATVLESAHVAGRVKLHRNLLVLHDPLVTELSELVLAYPLGELAEIEVAVDFVPTTARRGRSFLNRVHTYLRHGMAPIKFSPLAHAKPAPYDALMHKTVRGRLSAKSPGETIYWWNRRRYMTLRLYVKVKDQGSRIPNPFVRIEIALHRGGCQEVGAPALGHLPELLANLRRTLGAAFMVARGAKFNPSVTKSDSAFKRTLVEAGNRKQARRIERGFNRHGAAWCVKHGIPLAPDTTIGRRVGSALQRLGERHVSVLLDPKKRISLETALTARVAAYQSLMTV